MSRLYNRIDVVKIQPTLGQEKTRDKNENGGRTAPTC